MESGDDQNWIHRFLQENEAGLTGIICSYIARMGLARGENIRLLATEVLQDAALELLAHADRLDPGRQPHAWFLRVAANILKRKRANFARRYRFEVLVSDLAQRAQVDDENDVLDLLMADRVPDPEQMLAEREHVSELLALVTESDAEILRLALVQDLDSEHIAEQLGVKSGAVRVRLHRALRRLRIAWKKREERERGQDHG
ncbi:MAG TPA: sigma-70 family RNA polymerase sigma factor [Ktedonobacteraceae bacterium]|nr:sigma-70 family RNA polymerase sigma factor [Ktedonobacteraceae bacterium]